MPLKWKINLGNILLDKRFYYLKMQKWPLILWAPILVNTIWLPIKNWATDNLNILENLDPLIKASIIPRQAQKCGCLNIFNFCCENSKSYVNSASSTKYFPPKVCSCWHQGWEEPCLNPDLFSKSQDKAETASTEEPISTFTSYQAKGHNTCHAYREKSRN